MSSWAAKRFWSEVSIRPEADGHAVYLDARPVRTPAKAALRLPTPEVAELVAEEWRAQEGTVDPRRMPATRMANAAIDKVAPQQAEVADLLVDYGETDLLCYRAESPEALTTRQADAWDPVLDWAATAFGARLRPTKGVLPIPQDADAIAALAAEVRQLDAFGLSAFHDLVSLSGSLVLALAVRHGRLDPAEAWDISRIDETWQQEQWGVDEEAAEAAAIKRAAFLFAHRFMTAIGQAKQG